jgi:transposase
VRVRKFFCDNDACPRRIFAERLADVARAYARRTDRQRGALTTIAFAVGGEAGARLARKLGMLISPDTLLRPVPTVLGVDDWAIHKGLTYGTILVDLARHRPVDLLPDRSTGRGVIALSRRPSPAALWSCAAARRWRSGWRQRDPHHSAP